MKTIKDIRIYKSVKENEHGIPVTVDCSDKHINVVIHRIVMKLRKNNFTFGEFDHLYINFTTCDMDNEIQLLNNVDRYHPWYRYCNVKVSDEMYDNLGTESAYDYIISAIYNVLATCFTTDDFNKTKIQGCVKQAVEQGEKMLMKFKEKATAKRKAIIFLRYLDDGRYFPLLQVYDTDDKLLFEKDLPDTLTLDYLGDIQVSMKQVAIKPRKNSFTNGGNVKVYEY